LRDELVGQAWRARCRVVDGVQCRRETVEVVPGFRLHGIADQQVGALPVRGYHQHRSRARQAGGQARQGRATGAGFQGEHRRTVGNEQAGQHGELLDQAFIFGSAARCFQRKIPMRMNESADAEHDGARMVTMRRHASRP